MKRNFLLNLLLAAGPLAFPALASAEDIKGLTVIVNFGNNPQITKTSSTQQFPAGLPTAFSPQQQKNIYRLLNELNYTATTNKGSLRDYYLDNSKGLVNLTSDVVVVDLPNSPDNLRSAFENGGDTWGKVTTYQGQEVLSVTAGPMPSLINKALCQLGENSISTGCSAPISYKRVIDGSTISPTINTPYDFGGLTTNTAVYNGDWLDMIHATGLFPLEGVPDLTNAHLLRTYKFVQFVVPTSGADTPAWGGNYNEGLWPRSLPLLTANQYATSGLKGIPLGRTQLVPLDAFDPELGVMTHETGHTLYGFKDYYDTQQLSFKTAANWARKIIATNQTEFYALPNTVDDLNRGLNAGIGTLFPPNPQKGYDKTHSTNWYKSLGVADLSLMGNHGDRNPPLIDAMHREKAGWEAPKDLIDAKENDVYTLDWQATGADPKIARSFKYCKPNSNVSECFYLEARVAGSFRDSSSLRPVYTKFNQTDVQGGLLIWHAEDYKNPIDFAVNQRKDRTAGLHFDVSVVEADGKNDLTANWTGLNLPPMGNEKFFGAPYSNFTSFNDTTSAAKALWWDKTPSGLSITDIKTIGTQVTFKIGKRPERKVFFDFDDTKFTASIVEKEGPTGMTPVVPAISLSPSTPQSLSPGKIKLVITPKNNATFSYKVYAGSSSATSVLTGTNTVTLTSTNFNDTVIKVVEASYRTAVSSVKFMMDRGASVVYFSPSIGGGKTISIPAQEYLTSGSSVVPSYNCYNNVCEPVRFFASAKRGFTITGWEVQYNDGTSASLSNDPQIKIDPAKLNNIKLVRAKAERNIAELNLCADNAVEQWQWDGEYNDVGTLVRYGSAVYASNLPRANQYKNRLQYYLGGYSTIGAMTPAYTPQTTGIEWRIEERCAGAPGTANGALPLTAPADQCAAAPAWSPDSTYGAGAVVKHAKRLWAMRSTYTNNLMGEGAGIMPGKDSAGIHTIPANKIPPGVHDEIWTALTGSLQEVSEDSVIYYPLGIASMYPRTYTANGYLAYPSMWVPNGICP
ncbi:MAG: hypothetical protein U1F46_02965 [Marinagarivorans sp.]